MKNLILLAVLVSANAFGADFNLQNGEVRTISISCNNANGGNPGNPPGRPVVDCNAVGDNYKFQMNFCLNSGYNFVDCNQKVILPVKQNTPNCMSNISQFCLTTCKNKGYNAMDCMSYCN